MPSSLPKFFQTKQFQPGSSPSRLPTLPDVLWVAGFAVFAVSAANVYWPKAENFEIRKPRGQLLLLWGKEYV